MTTSGIDALREEHRLIMDVLGVLERAMSQPVATRVADPEELLHCVEFLEEFGVRWHEARDEQLLFPWLVQRRPELASTVGLLVREHESLREDLRRLESWIREARRGDPHAPGTSRRIARQLVTDLGSHLRREEELIYAAAASLPAEDGMELMESLDRFERNGRRFEVRDRYVALARELVRGRPAAAPHAAEASAR